MLIEHDTKTICRYDIIPYHIADGGIHEQAYLSISLCLGTRDIGADKIAFDDIARTAHKNSVAGSTVDDKSTHRATRGGTAKTQTNPRKLDEQSRWTILGGRSGAGLSITINRQGLCNLRQLRYRSGLTRPPLGNCICPCFRVRSALFDFEDNVVQTRLSVGVEDRLP